MTDAFKLAYINVTGESRSFARSMAGSAAQAAEQ